MNDTVILPDDYVLNGFHGDYVVKVAKHGDLHHPLTPCCGASGKGSMTDDGEGCVVCRSCYHEVDDIFGTCWVGDEFATSGPKPL